MFRSVRTKLIISMLTLGILPMAIGGIISYSVTTRAMTNYAEGALMKAPEPVIRRIEDFLESRWYDVLHTSYLSLFRKLDNAKEIQSFFEREMDTYKSFALIEVANASGKVIAASGEEKVGKDASREDWFMASRNISFDDWESERNSVYVKDVYSDSAADNFPSIGFATPIYDCNGKFKGAIHAVVHTFYFAEVVADIRISGTRSALLVATDGTVIADENGAVTTLERNVATLKAFQISSDTSVSFVTGHSRQSEVNSAPHYGTVYTQNLGELPSQPHLLHGTDDKGTSCFISYTPLEKFARRTGLRWSLLVFQPTVEIYGPAKRQAMFFALLLLCGVFAVSFGAMAIAKRISKPVQDLAEASRKIGSGDLDQRLEVKSRDEIGKLAEAFNQMAADLKESREATLSALKEVEKSRKEITMQRNQLHAILSNIAEGVAVENSNYEIEFMSEQLSKKFGNRLGDKCYNVFWNRTEPCPSCSLHKIVKEGEGTSEHAQKDTKGRVFEVLTTHFENHHDAPLAVEIFRDITEKKELERQILHSEKLASLGQMAAGIAHEIGNPLSSLSSAAQLLLMEDLTEEERKEYLTAITDLSDRIDKTVRKLLNFTREREEQEEAVNVNDLLDEALRLTSTYSRVEDIKIRKEFAAELPIIYADRSLLTLVFFNLIMNAIEAMTNGGELRVKTKLTNNSSPASDRDKYISVVFSDTGCGISEEDVAKIFTPLFTKKRRGKGTGLGLPISKKIVERYGGKIEVESKPGAGSTFTVSLPVC